MEAILQKYYEKMKRKIPEMLEFEIIYGILSFTIGYPLVKFLIYHAEKIAKTKILSLETLNSIVSNPISIILLIIALLYLVIFSAIEISGLMAIYYNDRKYSFLSFRVLKEEIVEDMRRLLKLKNIPMVLWMLLIFPISGNISTFIKQKNIPKFILIGIYENKIYIILFIIASLFFIYIYIKNIFIYISFFTENKPFMDAKRKAVRIIKNKFIRTIILIGLNTVFLTGLTEIINFIWHEILTSIIYSFNDYSQWLIVPIMIAKTLLEIMPFLSNALIIIGNIVLVSVLYEEYSGENIAYNFQTDYRKSIISRFKKQIIFFSIILLVGNGIMTNIYLKNGIAADFNENYITAHRGNNYNTPENSISGINSSILEGADYIEIDLQLSKDKEVILLHDKNFKRTGNNMNEPKDLELNEIKKINIGKTFDRNYKDEFIPSLDEVLKKTIGKIKYNLELKPYDGDIKTLVSKTIELVKKYNQEENVIITSLYKDCLDEVKKIDQNIKTGYITVILGNEIGNIENIDVLCVEESALTEEKVAKIHLKGKEVFAWTINEKEDIDRMLRFQVDNIITDNTKQALLRRSYYMNMNPYLRRIEYFLRLENKTI